MMYFLALFSLKHFCNNFLLWRKRAVCIVLVLYGVNWFKFRIFFQVAANFFNVIKDSISFPLPT